MDSEKEHILGDWSLRGSAWVEHFLVSAMSILSNRAYSRILRSSPSELQELVTENGLNGLIRLLLPPDTSSEVILFLFCPDALLWYAITDKLVHQLFAIRDSNNARLRQLLNKKIKMKRWPVVNISKLYLRLLLNTTHKKKKLMEFLIIFMGTRKSGIILRLIDFFVYKIWLFSYLDIGEYNDDIWKWVG
jgi:hypothetical protein